MPEPARPEDIPDETAVGKLATAYEWHVGALQDHTARRETLTAAQRHRSIRAALALGAKLRERVAAERWPLVVDALACGDSPEQVAASASLETCELTEGVAAWADGLVESGAFTPVQRDHALAKARFAQQPDGTWSL